MKFYSDQDRQEWAAEVNELALDFMRRLAIAEEKALQQENILRHTIRTKDQTIRDLTRQLDEREEKD